MSDLFNRDFRCQIGAANLSIQTPNPLIPDTIAPALRASFRVEKTTAPEPNTAIVTIYNLNVFNRKLLQDGAERIAQAIKAAKKLGVKAEWDWPLVIEAGYVDDIAQIFSGDVLYARSNKERVDWMTEVEAEDGGPQFSNARISMSFGAGTTLYALLVYIVKQLGVGLGNSVAQFAKPKRPLILFKRGVVVEGKVSNVLDKYCSSAGFGWSIQDGQLQILAQGETLVESIVKVSPTSGLIGSPELGEEGTVNFRTLLTGKIKPGKRVVLDSEIISGMFRAERVTYSGDTWAQDWYNDVEASPL